MKLRQLNALLLAIGFGALMLAGCGGESDTGSGQACSLSSDCPSGELCLRVGDAAACAINCSVNADACGGSAGCEGVGQLSVNVCQEKKTETTGEPESPKEAPYIPCGSDKECSALEAGAVCAQWRGSRDCTITCTTSDACNPPAAGGVKTEFFACQPDESNTSRTVCLPREECFNDPTSCITYPMGPGGFDGGPGF
jgi:hypothetical protein